MGVSNATHVASLVVLFAFLANSKTGIGEFDIENLMKPRWRESENVAMRNGLGIHHLLKAEGKKQYDVST